MKFNPVIKPDNLTITRRNLPHWQAGGSWYHVIFMTRFIILPEKRRDFLKGCVAEGIGGKYELAVAVIMPDHVHMLISPMLKKGNGYYPLREITKPLKGLSARKINLLPGRAGPLWVDESFDRIIRDEEDWRGKYGYIMNNPVKEGLVEKPEDYPWLIVNSNAGH